jgi:hypothetical protein
MAKPKLDISTAMTNAQTFRVFIGLPPFEIDSEFCECYLRVDQ